MHANDVVEAPRSTGAGVDLALFCSRTRFSCITRHTGTVTANIQQTLDGRTNAPWLSGAVKYRTPFTLPSFLPVGF